MPYHCVPKTAFWISKPWQLELDQEGNEDGENRSCDPLSFRLFPNGLPADPNESYFRNPVIILGKEKYVFELDDLVKWIRTKRGFINPLDNQTFDWKDVRPVRFPGFQYYQETIDKLKKLSFRNLSQLQGGKWEDPNDDNDPAIGSEEHMRFELPPSRRDIQDAPSDAQPASVKRPRSAKPPPADLVEPALDIMRQVIAQYIKDNNLQTNVRVDLDVLYNLFQAAAVRQGQASLGTASRTYVRRLLYRIANNEQKNDQKNNVEIIHTNNTGMAFLLNALPLMRLARLFACHIAGSENKFFRNNQGIEMFKFFIQRQKAWNNVFTTKQMLIALFHVPGVRVEIGPRGKVISVEFSPAEIQPVPVEGPGSGFNEGQILLSGLQSMPSRAAAAAGGGLGGAGGGLGGAGGGLGGAGGGLGGAGGGLGGAGGGLGGGRGLGGAGGGLGGAGGGLGGGGGSGGRSGGGSMTGDQDASDNDDYDDLDRPILRRPGSLRPGPALGGGAGAYDAIPPSGDLRRSRGGRVYGILADALNRFVQSFRQKETITNLRMFRLRFFQFCSDNNIGIKSTSFSDRDFLQAVMDTRGIRQDDNRISIVVDNVQPEFNEGHGQRERTPSVDSVPFESVYGDMMTKFVSQYIPPFEFKYLSDLMREFQRFCLRLNFEWKVDRFSNENIREAWQNFHGVQYIDRPPPASGEGGMPSDEGGSFLVGFDMPSIYD